VHEHDGQVEVGGHLFRYFELENLSVALCFDDAVVEEPFRFLCDEAVCGLRRCDDEDERLVTDGIDASVRYYLYPFA